MIQSIFLICFHDYIKILQNKDVTLLKTSFKIFRTLSQSADKWLFCCVTIDCWHTSFYYLVYIPISTFPTEHRARYFAKHFIRKTSYFVKTENISFWFRSPKVNFLGLCLLMFACVCESKRYITTWDNSDINTFEKMLVVPLLCMVPHVPFLFLSSLVCGTSLSSVAAVLQLHLSLPRHFTELLPDPEHPSSILNPLSARDVHGECWSGTPGWLFSPCLPMVDLDWNSTLYISLLSVLSLRFPIHHLLCALLQWLSVSRYFRAPCLPEAGVLSDHCCLLLSTPGSLFSAYMFLNPCTGPMLKICLKLVHEFTFPQVGLIYILTYIRIILFYSMFCTFTWGVVISLTLLCLLCFMLDPIMFYCEFVAEKKERFNEVPPFLVCNSCLLQKKSWTNLCFDRLYTSSPRFQAAK